jgi:FkbM family methyltransferase
MGLLYLGFICFVRRSKVRISFDPTSSLFYVQAADSRKIYLSHINRALNYQRGIDSRLNQLYTSYCLDLLEEITTGVVIDCGANIGELGLALGPDVEYVAFEPDPKAFSALSLNLPEGAKAICSALSNQNGYGTFYLASESADSSLISPQDRPPTGELIVKLETLDSYAKEKGLESVHLLKLEAEGFEPEVLTGGVETLKRTKYVALDAGPERNGENTITACFNILYSGGFQLVGANHRQSRFLFARL